MAQCVSNRCLYEIMHVPVDFKKGARKDEVWIIKLIINHKFRVASFWNDHSASVHGAKSIRAGMFRDS